MACRKVCVCDFCRTETREEDLKPVNMTIYTSIHKHHHEVWNLCPVCFTAPTSSTVKKEWLDTPR
jgi:hypothetical protein